MECGSRALQKRFSKTRIWQTKSVRRSWIKSVCFIQFLSARVFLKMFAGYQNLVLIVIILYIHKNENVQLGRTKSSTGPHAARGPRVGHS